MYEIERELLPPTNRSQKRPPTIPHSSTHRLKHARNNVHQINAQMVLLLIIINFQTRNMKCDQHCNHRQKCSQQYHHQPMINHMHLPLQHFCIMVSHSPPLLLPLLSQKLKMLYVKREIIFKNSPCLQII